MRILVGWDNVPEADTIALFLNVGENAAKVTTDAGEFAAALSNAWWDVVLMALSFPSAEASPALFEKVRHLQPDASVIAACHSGENYRILSFLARGLHSYVVRDPRG